ncbi:glycosyltransferase family 4 protein [Reichenbachiella carrageenanivorans]|uniref:Glycosyltransferase family 4 protein n=1 Tax=Reichenbachiella carrageenanivorans TaxID=2979869 RepID=A0ABY6D3D6_9BACT|nr:glycosyltransferase family 4 protein [Reichenbachiella carrageenanivorans]UXX78350.1 glycosyltransferase family 4 protein [Reichenbachiella carrageenanivorans]
MTQPILGMIFHGEYPTHPRIENQALHLISEGMEVHLFCVTYKKEKDHTELYKGIYVHRYYLPNWMYKLSALAYSFPLYHQLIKPKLADFLQNSKADILHLHNMYLAEPVFRLTQQNKLPVVLDLHENVPEIMKYYPHLQTAFGRLLINPKTWKKKEEKFIKQAERILVVTHDAKTEIESRTGIVTDKIWVLPNFTDTSFVKTFYDQNITSRFTNSFNALYIGDTGNRRGLESVIKAIPLIINDIPCFKLIIVGASSNDPMLKDLIKKEKVSAHVSAEGWQPEQLLSDYVNVADVGICPILRNIHHDTTYANKLFQYAMLGKPMLVSDCTAQKNLIEQEKWGLVHQAGDAKDFAKQIKLLFNNKEIRQQFGSQAAKAIKEKYNFKSSGFGVTFYQNLGN